MNQFPPSVNPWFIFYCFKAGWAAYIANKQFGSATNYIVVGDLKAFPVPLPPIARQATTVAHLYALSEETQRLESL